MSGRSTRSNTWRFSICVAHLGSSDEPQWPHAHASCRTVRSGSATCSKSAALVAGLAAARLARAAAQAARDARLLLQPVARRGLGTVRAVLPQLAAKVRHFSLKRRNPPLQRGDQLFDFGRENHPILDSDSPPVVSENPPTKLLSTIPVTFRTHPAWELRISAITNEVSEGDTGALAVPVRKRGGRGGTDRSCGASLVFGAVARGRTGAIGGAPRGGERQPGLERSADGVGAGVAEPCRGRGSRRSRPAGGGRRSVPAGAGGRARAHSAGAAGRGAALAAAAVAHAALAACDGPVAYGFHDAGEEARREAGRARGRGGPVTGERRSSAGGSGAASGGAGDARHGRHAG